MDQETFQSLSAAPYPAPPPFWKHFTSNNIKRAKSLDLDGDVPLEIRFLRPPEPPAPNIEEYVTFATPWKLDPAPELPPADLLLFDHSSPVFNHAKALKHLTISLLLNFLELTGVLSNDPVKYEEKLHHIERLMLNVHFVVNLYRPHQAREGVKEMLQGLLEDGHREMARCEEIQQRVESFMRELAERKEDFQRQDERTLIEDPNNKHDNIWTLIHDIKDD